MHLRTRTASALSGTDLFDKKAVRKVLFENGGNVPLAEPGVDWKVVTNLRHDVLEQFTTKLKDVFEEIYDKMQKGTRSSVEKYLLPTVKTPRVIKSKSQRPPLISPVIEEEQPSHPHGDGDPHPDTSPCTAALSVSPLNPPSLSLNKKLRSHPYMQCQFEDVRPQSATPEHEPTPVDVLPQSTSPDCEPSPVGMQPQSTTPECMQHEPCPVDVQSQTPVNMSRTKLLSIPLSPLIARDVQATPCPSVAYYLEEETPAEALETSPLNPSFPASYDQSSNTLEEVRAVALFSGSSNIRRTKPTVNVAKQQILEKLRRIEEERRRNEEERRKKEMEGKKQQEMLEKIKKRNEEEEQRKKEIEARKQQEILEKRRKREEKSRKVAEKQAALKKEVEEKNKRFQDQEKQAQINQELIKQKKLEEIRKREEEKSRKVAEKQAALQKEMEEKKKRFQDQGKQAQVQLNQELIKQKKVEEIRKRNQRLKERVEARRMHVEEEKRKKMQQLEEERRLADEMMKKRLEHEEEQKRQKLLEKEQQRDQRERELDTQNVKPASENDMLIIEELICKKDSPIKPLENKPTYNYQKVAHTPQGAKQCTSYTMTPADPIDVYENYDIGGLNDSDSTDDEDEPKKPIPNWARKSIIYKYMEKQDREQSSVDVNKIFPPEELLQDPDLGKIFVQKKRRFYKRSSSARWDSPLIKKPRLN